MNKQLQLLDAQAVVPLTKRLDSEIFVSESGFTQRKAGEFRTSLMVARWRLQIAALEKMLRQSK